MQDYVASVGTAGSWLAQEHSIHFKSLSCELPNGLKILHGASGKLLPQSVTAIMGASGAGKTTLMNVLVGKVRKSEGAIFLNGHLCENLGDFPSQYGFVPQEDVMHRELTVMQNLTFAAALQLPPGTGRSEILMCVRDVLVKLQLVHVRHSIVGDEYHRGISGGQRKRVNIGLELASRRPILFLDEPTTGLDSVTATQVVQMLATIARTHRMTVTAVIHNPGIRAFAVFTDLILLQPGGYVVFAGKTDRCVGYFDSIGF
ncbi:hypothetical protein AURANDRAFT_34292, partial [Aureococcus anophagefferens]